jgi:hypothetical protein
MARILPLAIAGLSCAIACVDPSASARDSMSKSSPDAARPHPSLGDAGSVPAERDAAPPDASLNDALLASFDAHGRASAAKRLVRFATAPAVEQNPEATAPLVFIVSWESNVATRAELEIEGGGESWTLAIDDPSTLREQPVLGCKPDTTYSATVRISDGNSSSTAEPVSFTTPPLPDDFPPIVATVSDSERMEPGMTLFNLRAPTGSMVIVDSAGEVRWYYDDPNNEVRTDHRRLANGNFLFEKDHRVIVEVDPLGRIVSQWYAANYPKAFDVPEGGIAVDVDSFHHEIAQLADDTFLTLSTELRDVPDYPTSEDDPTAPTAPATVLAQVIVEFNRKGEVLKRISLLDLLDPTRIGRGSLRDNWQETYGDGKEDWAHANAVAYDPSTDCYYVSLRQQDAIVAIDRTTERVKWILGTHSNWKKPWSKLLLEPEGELEWPFHQHAVEATPGGVGMYDNGNYRAAAFETNDSPPYSRGVVYEVDPVAMTVRQKFSYGGPDGGEQFYCGAIGDADLQPESGNELITNGLLARSSGGYWAQLLEVTAKGTRVFQLDLGSPSGNGASTEVYRAQRLPDIRVADVTQ